MKHLDLKEIEPFIKAALKEDIGKGDITTDLIVPKDIKVKGVMQIKEEGIIAGLEIAQKVFALMDNKIEFQVISEGKRVNSNQIIVKLKGDARSILTGERTALNFLQRLSGIATLTNKYVSLVKPYKVRIMDTRKTTPLWRSLEKYAVRVGGGYNHRMQLDEMVLVKDNHFQAVNKPLKEIIKLVRRKISPGMKIEVEIENWEKTREGKEADIIMLDNMNLRDIKKVVKVVKSLGKKRPLLEVSGGINLDNVVEIAKTGVDMISVGALTHSAPALDISMKVTAR